MIESNNIKTRWYFLPEDGIACCNEFLKILNGGYNELWISAFGFTLQGMFDAIKAADANGVKIHILLDHSQSGGTAEKPKVQDLVNSMKNGDVTITTAGINSPNKSNIWHWKAMVAKFNDGNDDIDRFGSALGVKPAYICWQGSTNFSISAWSQGNDASIFADDNWAQTFITQQQEHIAWAQKNEPQYQLKVGDPIITKNVRPRKTPKRRVSAPKASKKSRKSSKA